MKNNFLFQSVIITCFFFKVCFSQEVFFDASNIKIMEEGNIINSFGGKAIIPEDKVEVEGDESIYDKKKLILTIIKNVKFTDQKENIYIEGEKIIYNRMNNIIYSIGDTFVKVDNKYEINSSNLYYDRNLMEIYSEEDTHIKDDLKNVYNFEKGFKLENLKETLTSKKANVIDNQNNYYYFENVKIDLKNKEIAGKEITVEFVDSLFDNEENDPKLRGRSIISNDKFTKIYKSVFSTCNTEKNKCRGWELHSKEFNHDKAKQIFEYKNSWLKMFGKKVMYFPYFNHPDPTVRRKSGFLTPEYSSSDNLGRWIKTPYFKVLSHDKDMTFSPKLYRQNDFILQTEYRQIFENSFLISDFSYNQDGGSTNANLFTNLSGKIDEDTSYEIQFQNVTNDDFLKKHSMHYSSPLIKSESVLVSKLGYEKIKRQSESENSEITSIEHNTP